MRHRIVRTLRLGGTAAAFALAVTAAAAAHPDVPLKDHAGNELTPASTAPYSPKQTCGACHDYDEITRGYHFQQGWDELYTAEEKAEKPWLQGPGMAGKW
ncbi:MAG: hypothetical protein D6708_09805 [Candidatus Dadabacteria bacterium]|nr:MAG: hypothetical protein D6708_09805 [Candidatus Dadabacteria bacterium]